MKTSTTKDLKPCPVCGSHDIVWGGYYYVSLVCKNCLFEMWPFDDLAPEEDYYKEWNNLENLDKTIESYKAKIEKADKDDEKIVNMLKDLLSYYEELKKKIKEAREQRQSQNS